MIETPLTRYALSIARNAHAGQTDKAGRPYIEHPLHVAESMDTEVETCAALFVHVMDGTARYTAPCTNETVEWV